MPKPRSEPPPCYAIAFAGLEEIVREEVVESLHGDIKRCEPGIVVFRLPEVNDSILGLRAAEDVFLFAWGTDQLTYKADDLDRIRRWTAKDVDWSRLLQIHHAIRPKPKGKPSYRLVTQMTGEHAYRRMDAGKALARGLEGKLPASWRHVEENAAVEIWLTIHGATAVCGLRLSDATMRHRTYKREHLPASLRPTVAAAMVRLAGALPNQVVLDPMCGAGTILAEQAEIARARLWGGDLELSAVRAAEVNLRRFHPAVLARWDAARLPLPDRSVDRLISNPPFGVQLGQPEDIGPLYRRMVPEYDRVLRPGGRAVLLAGDPAPLREAARLAGWKRTREFRIRILGQPAALTVWMSRDREEALL